MKAKKICSACGLEESKSKECDMHKLRIDGMGYHRIRYGSSEEGFGPAVGKCMGCGVRPGKNHHWNCLYEVCPVCHQQLISCNCEQEMFLE